MKGIYKVISLFSGCGGSDLGMQGGFTYLGNHYSRLPFETAFAVDKDAKAVATYNVNFDVPAVQGSIEDIRLNDLPSEPDIVVGGFPCQSFSTVNPTKNPFDERGRLFRSMSDILRQTQPKAFIAENVKGFYLLKKGAIFREAEGEFTSAGYKVSHALLNAANFGVPQKRERLFMVGIRDDLELNFHFPYQTHAESAFNGFKPWVGIRNVIDSLIPEDPKYYFSEKAVLGMKMAKTNMKRGLWQDLEKPCLTITSHLAKVSINSRDPVLLVDEANELYRRFTPREAARIQSFPDSFQFVGSEADAYRQIGQAIAPVMMWHIANQLSKALRSLDE